MCRARSLRVIPVYFSLSLLVFSQTASQRPTTSKESARTESEFPAIYGQASVEWPAPVPDGSLLLTMSGPSGLYTRQEYPAGHWPRFGLVDEQGQPRPDGIYKWELIRQSGWEVPDQTNQVQSGWFEIQSGKVVREGMGEKQVAVVEEQAPASSLYVDSQGRVGLGTSVPASQLHLKGTAPAFTLEDTATGGGVFTWRGLEKGDGSLGLFDKAGQARWLVDSQGRIGIGTTKPTSTLTVDGYVEATKGFLVNGKPVEMGFGLIGGSQPLSTETANNNFFGTGAGAASPTGSYDSFFGGEAGYSDTTGAENSFFGAFAGRSTTTGGLNSFFGKSAGYFNTAGERNSFFGAGAGKNSTGSDNSFFGTFAGYYNQAASWNSFFGEAAGYNTTTGDSNSFFGYHAGYSNVTGSNNAFFGRSAGRDNTTGNLNSFFGEAAGIVNTTGIYNTFVGTQAGWSNIDGSFNSFFGVGAGILNTTATHNSFFGQACGQSNITGSNNSFFGSGSGSGNTTGLSNSSFGFNAGYSNTTENYNTFVGAWANLSPGTPGTVTNATAIGARAYVAQSNSLVLGSIAGLNGGPAYVNVGIGTTTPARQLHLAGPNAVFRMDRSTNTASFILVRTDPTGAIPWKTFVVGTDASGVDQGEFIINDIGTAVGGGGNRRMTITNAGDVQFTGNVFAASFTQTSSAAFKTNIRTFENALETVNRLRGVRFDWKDSGKPAVGLIAEEVEEVVPEVVAQENGKARGVNYDNLVAVLVEAVKEQQKRIQEDRKTIREQQAEIDNLKGLKAEVESLKRLLRAR